MGERAHSCVLRPRPPTVWVSVLMQNGKDHDCLCFNHEIHGVWKAPKQRALTLLSIAGNIRALSPMRRNMVRISSLKRRPRPRFRVSYQEMASLISR